MSLLGDLRTYLLADTDIASAVGIKIYAKMTPQGTAFPYVVMSYINSNPDGDVLTHDEEMDNDFVQLSVFSDRVLDCENIKDLIRKRINRKNNFLMGSYWIFSFTFRGFTDLDEKETDGTEIIITQYALEYDIRKRAYAETV